MNEIEGWGLTLIKEFDSCGNTKGTITITPPHDATPAQIIAVIDALIEDCGAVWATCVEQGYPHA